MNPKQILLRPSNEALANWWRSIVSDSRFETICTMAMAREALRAPSDASLAGANSFLQNLETIAEPEENQVPITPGIIHNPQLTHGNRNPDRSAKSGK